MRFVFTFLLGAAASFFAGFLSSATPLSQLVVLLLIAPIIEEMFRTLSLALSRLELIQHKVQFGLVNGLGFGLAEALPRWLGDGELSPILFAGTLVPLLLHIVLSGVIAKRLPRMVAPTLFCIAIHALHNVYVAFAVTSYTLPQYSFDVFFRFALICSVGTILLKSARIGKGKKGLLAPPD